MAEAVGSRCINIEENYTLKWLEAKLNWINIQIFIDLASF